MENLRQFEKATINYKKSWLDLKVFVLVAEPELSDSLVKHFHKMMDCDNGLTYSIHSMKSYKEESKQFKTDILLIFEALNFIEFRQVGPTSHDIKYNDEIVKQFINKLNSLADKNTYDFFNHITTIIKMALLASTHLSDTIYGRATHSDLSYELEILQKEVNIFSKF
jgi:hypothetical protein